MRGKILTWDEFREYCKEDAYYWHESGYSIADVTEADILSEYSDDYFTDSTDDDYDELSSCFTADEFAAKTFEYLGEIENEERKGKNMVKVKTFFSGWKEISEEQALKWARHIYNGMTTRTSAGKVDYINARLDGIQFTEQELRGGTK